jgi:translocation protein SEC72
MSLPIIYDSDTKLLSLDKDQPQVILGNDDTLELRIQEINRLTKDLVATKTEVPESPEPSAALAPLIKKLVTSGIDSLKQKKLKEAIKQLTLAIDMAGRRARWEAFAVQLQELNAILQIRCDAYLLNGDYLEAYNDAEVLISTQTLTADNFLRKAVCALNLGRFDQAKIDLERGLCFHPDNSRMKEHLDLVNRAIDIENGDI